MSAPRKPNDPSSGGPSDDERDRKIAELERALADAATRNKTFEAQLADQQRRLEVLGSGRETTLLALTEARDELRRVARERDELRRYLARIDSVQTSTVALPDPDDGPLASSDPPPSLEELMLALGEIPAANVVGDSHLQQHAQVERDGNVAEEMLSPELVFPEKFATTAATGTREANNVSRMLVLLDSERPVKYPLHKEIMIVGRADSADIQIDNSYLSRLHARVISTHDSVVIEDVESKNGIRVNAKLAQRATLRHGDIVDIGRLRFRYIDSTEEDGA